MRWLHRKHARRGVAHIADDGKVRCNRRNRDVDIELCIGCLDFEDLVNDGTHTYLYCHDKRVSPRDAWMYEGF